MAATAVAAACTTSGSDVIPAGVYGGTGTLTGSSTLNGGTSSFAAAPYIRGIISTSGSYMFLSYRTGSPNTVTQIDVGTGSASDGMFTAANDTEFALQAGYDTAPGGIAALVEGAQLSAAFAPMSTFDATIDYPPNNGSRGDDELTFPATWAAGSVTPPSQAQVAATYTGVFASNVNTSSYGNNTVPTATLTISSSGALSGTILCLLGQINGGTAVPCTVSGTVTPSADVDAYDVSLSFASGSGSPPAGGALPPTWAGKVATGMGYLDPATGKLTLGVAAPDNTAFAFSN